MNYEKIGHFVKKTEIAPPTNVENALPADWMTAFINGEELEVKDTSAVIPKELRTHDRGAMRMTLRREPELSRREVLRKGLGAGAALAAGALTSKLFSPEKATKSEGKETSVVGVDDTASSEERIHVPDRTIDMPTGSLAGRKVGDLFAYYLGLEPGSVVPPVLTVNFAQVLEHLWDRKVALVARKKAENDLWIQNTKENGRKIFFGQYAEKWGKGEVDTRTMPEVIAHADRVIADTNKSLDWSGFNTLKIKNAEGRDYAPFGKLNQAAVRIVHDIANEITGEMLMAYSVTELMPSLVDGEQNVEEYRLLMQYAGAEFLNGAPALGDPFLSTGPFQFTQFAIFDAEGERRGASIINQLAPKGTRIPGSVSKLTTLDSQLKAAHLFAIHNIALLVQDIVKDSNQDRKVKRLTTLIKNKEFQAGLVQYIASAHHAPGAAIPAFKKWLDVGMKGSHAAHASNKLDMKAYIKKSFLNFVALKKMYPKQV